MSPPRLKRRHFELLPLVVGAKLAEAASRDTTPFRLLRSLGRDDHPPPPRSPTPPSRGTSAPGAWTFDEPCDTVEWTPPPEVDIEAKAAADPTGITLDDDLILMGVFAPSSSDDAGDDGGDAGGIPPELAGKAKELDDELGGALSGAMEENSKTFKNGSVVGLMTPVIRVSSEGEDGNIKIMRYALIGLGKRNDGDDGKKGHDDEVGVRSAGRKIGSSVASACASEGGVRTCSVVLPGGAFRSPSALSELASAFSDGLYSDNRYRTGSRVKTPAEDVERVTVVLEGGGGGDGAAALSPEEAGGAIEAGRKVALGTYLARDIVNSPHNALNTLGLADTARRLAAESGGLIRCNILEKDDCEARGMGAYLGVARGSETPPKFIHLVYRPRSGDVLRKVGVVGKGLLFDTGGYNIKTSMMELMKFDCGGAAAVLGAARSVAALEPGGVEAHFVVAACENMINERAVVPGDVLVASNGRTIEVVNTDAEGRLTMADALVYADEEVGCDRIIELSTLTGACMVALGNKISGLWTADDGLAEELESLSKATGEKVWRMPLEREYNELIESKIADMKNLGTRYGGSITAALFLQNFVKDKKPFAHIDMAGPVWNAKTGATGYGAKLVTEWVCKQGKP